DRRLVEHALALPSPFKVGDGCRKRILFDAMRGRLPTEVLDRPGRVGFAVPEERLLRGAWPAARDAILEGALPASGYLRAAAGRGGGRQSSGRVGRPTCAPSGACGPSRCGAAPSTWQCSIRLMAETRRARHLLLCATGGFQVYSLPGFVLALLRHCADDVQ